MHLSMSKNENLANKLNKQRFIDMLGTALEKKGCKCYYYASADANLLRYNTLLHGIGKGNSVKKFKETSHFMKFLIHHVLSYSCRGANLSYLIQWKIWRNS